jgi:hypothetical protein
MKSSNHSTPGKNKLPDDGSDLKSAFMLRSGTTILNLLSVKSRLLFRQNNGFNYMSYWSFIFTAFIATILI